jgi:hypothetical protein
MRAADAVWFATCGAVAQWWRSTHATSGAAG